MQRLPEIDDPELSDRVQSVFVLGHCVTVAGIVNADFVGDRILGEWWATAWLIVCVLHGVGWVRMFGDSSPVTLEQRLGHTPLRDALWMSFGVWWLNYLFERMFAIHALDTRVLGISSGVILGLIAGNILTSEPSAVDRVFINALPLDRARDWRNKCRFLVMSITVCVVSVLMIATALDVRPLVPLSLLVAGLSVGASFAPVFPFHHSRRVRRWRVLVALVGVGLVVWSQHPIVALGLLVVLLPPLPAPFVIAYRDSDSPSWHLGWLEGMRRNVSGLDLNPSRETVGSLRSRLEVSRSAIACILLGKRWWQSPDPAEVEWLRTLITEYVVVDIHESHHRDLKKARRSSWRPLSVWAAFALASQVRLLVSPADLLARIPIELRKHAQAWWADVLQMADVNTWAEFEPYLPEAMIALVLTLILVLITIPLLMFTIRLTFDPLVTEWGVIALKVPLVRWGAFTKFRFEAFAVKHEDLSRALLLERARIIWLGFAHLSVFFAILIACCYAIFAPAPWTAHSAVGGLVVLSLVEGLLACCCLLALLVPIAVFVLKRVRINRFGLVLFVALEACLAYVVGIGIALCVAAAAWLSMALIGASFLEWQHRPRSKLDRVIAISG